MQLHPLVCFSIPGFCVGLIWHHQIGLSTCKTITQLTATQASQTLLGLWLCVAISTFCEDQGLQADEMCDIQIFSSFRWFTVGEWHHLNSIAVSIISTPNIFSCFPPECRCHNHADSCHFDLSVWLASGKRSGGVCNNCKHNTEGHRCQRCKPGYYRDRGKPMSSTEVCKRKWLLLHVVKTNEHRGIPKRMIKEISNSYRSNSWVLLPFLCIVFLNHSFLVRGHRPDFLCLLLLLVSHFIWW